MGSAVWCQDEAGPFTTRPCPGAQWRPINHPACQPHAYLRQGTAQLLTLFPPASGTVRVKGVRRVTHAVRHAWLKTEGEAILTALPAPADRQRRPEHRPSWERWQAGRSRTPSRFTELPPLRLILIWDTRVGHHPPDLMCWLFAHGILPPHWGQLAEYGRVHPADSQAPCTGRPTSPSPGGDHPMVGRHPPGLESTAHSLHLGRQKVRATTTR